MLVLDHPSLLFISMLAQYMLHLTHKSASTAPKIVLNGYFIVLGNIVKCVWKKKKKLFCIYHVKKQKRHLFNHCFYDNSLIKDYLGCSDY